MFGGDSVKEGRNRRLFSAIRSAGIRQFAPRPGVGAANCVAEGQEVLLCSVRAARVWPRREGVVFIRSAPRNLVCAAKALFRVVPRRECVWRRVLLVVAIDRFEKFKNV